MSNHNLYNQTNLINEKSYLDCNTSYNKKISNYQVNQLSINNEKLEEISLSQPNIYTRNGYGWTGNKGDLIDIDSSLRNCHNLTNMREIHPLNNKDYFYAPNLATGIGNPCLESVLLPGEDTIQKKSTNNMSGENISNERFNLLAETNKESYYKSPLISENVNISRSGESSRNLLKNPKILSQLGYTYNGKFWEKNDN
jgi:hypothetical protein